MTRSAHISRDSNDNAAAAIGKLVHLAMQRGLGAGRPVKIGTVRGIVIGYNISRDGNYPGTRYPLLVKTELGTAKFGLDEVMPA
ncbi:MAG: hypothetical protein HZA64_04890 [Rhodocyclales bacterium]|jgi:hypothetical protein|nr:hypothetical protein [Rhodocyclales bacterium]